MFLHRILDREARLAFAGLASHVLFASEELTPAEARLLYTMYAELELEVGALEPSETVEALALRITHPRARAASLLELFRLAFADGEYRAQERAIIARVAELWGASSETVSWLDDWVRRHAALVDEARGWIESTR